jgi:hypothetical protein
MHFPTGNQEIPEQVKLYLRQLPPAEVIHVSRFLFGVNLDGWTNILKITPCFEETIRSTTFQERQSVTPLKRGDHNVEHSLLRREINEIQMPLCFNS